MHPNPRASGGAAYDARLIDHAPGQSPEYDYAALTPAVLTQLTCEHVVDFATALWYDRARRAEPHRALPFGAPSAAPTPAQLPSDQEATSIRALRAAASCVIITQ